VVLTIDKKSLDLTVKEVTTDQIENKEDPWMTIDDLNSAKTILGSYSDEQKRLILEAALNESYTFSELLKICKIPQVSFYRKINSLIQEGLIVKKSLFIKPNRRRIKYKAVFKNLQINIDGNIIIIKGKLNKNF
jgi:DNA-binding HxlR family transcriptional regulator